MSGKIIDVSDSLNYDSSKDADKPNFQVYKDELYCTWTEYNFNKSSSQIKIKKYDGNSWINVSDSLNYDSKQKANDSMLQVYKDELYCAWHESNGSNYRIKIKKYDGTSWINISSNLNDDSSKHAYYPKMEVYKDELYCTWQETNGSNYQIKVKKYDGANWNSISNSLNYDSSKHADNPDLEIYIDELYCIWQEANGSNNQIKMKKYNGTSWTEVSNNINYSQSQNAELPRLQVYKDGLYCVWQELNSPNYRIKIKKYDGSNWSNISDSLNYDTSRTAYYPKMEVYNNELYCIWSERNGTINQIMMKKYNGSSWISVSDSLNYDSSKHAFHSKLQVYKDELYCVWYESNDLNNLYQIKVKKYTLLVEKIQKYLIKHNDKYFKINDDKEIIEVENNNFKTNGFDNINLVTRELLENKFHDIKNIQVLMWTNDIEKNEATMTCELRNPYRPIDILKKNNNGICNILFKEL